ncbi:hypothetical protein NGM10_05200 [Halorussus salilacus]|uniref:hypothetical protein n=1 Tax=Halorussus salilacus TaxID=2953750 RepID=UPI00209E5DE4|nr:hypothetical protein [Halorussus salilacus]USZ69135.1 hypothetical protein NGM10_05200 [Halorussus salilacus]
MEAGTAFALALTGATGLGFVVVAALSLRPESRFRRWYGIDPGDDAGARTNALVVGASGVGLWALAAAVVLGVSERVVGAGSVLVGGALCVALGWLIRYRDRRELLTTPDVDRETAEQLGASVIVCGLLVFPLAPAVWFGVGEAVVAGLGLGGALLSVLVIAWGYR